MTGIRNAFFALLFIAASASAADSGLLGLVMPDAKMFAGVQVDQSKSSTFGRYVLQQMEADDEKLRQFAAETGFDPRRDVREILMASTGDSNHTLILARGIFDPGHAQMHAKKIGSLINNYAGIDILLGKEKDSGGVAFIDTTLAMMGDIESLQGAIDRSKAKTLLEPALLAKIAEVSAANDAWFVSILPMAQLAGKMPDPNLSGMMKGNGLAGILQASGGVRFGASVLVSLEALTRSEKDASALVDVVKFIGGLIQLNGNNETAKGAASVLDTMTVRADSNNVVRMSLTLPETLMEQMFQPVKRKAPAHKTTASVTAR